MITNNYMRVHDRVQGLALGILFVCDTVGNQTVANVDDTVLDEVHLGNFFFLVIDDSVFALWLKHSWHKAKGHVIHKSCLVLGLNSKKPMEFLEDVRKQILSHNLLPDLWWQIFQVGAIRIEARKPVLGPDIDELGFDLLEAGLFEVLLESLEKEEPGVEVTAFVDNTHSFFVVANDFDEIAHDI